MGLKNGYKTWKDSYFLRGNNLLRRIVSWGPGLSRCGDIYWTQAMFMQTFLELQYLLIFTVNKKTLNILLVQAENIGVAARF